MNLYLFYVMVCMQAGEEQYIAAGFLYQAQYSSSVKLLIESTSLASSSLSVTVTLQPTMSSVPSPIITPAIRKELGLSVPIGAVGGVLAVLILVIVVAIAVW